MPQHEQRLKKFPDAKMFPVNTTQREILLSEGGLILQMSSSVNASKIERLGSEYSIQDELSEVDLEIILAHDLERRYCNSQLP
jgi:hypothetical protein